MKGIGLLSGRGEMDAKSPEQLARPFPFIAFESSHISITHCQEYCTIVFACTQPVTLVFEWYWTLKSSHKVIEAGS